MKTKLSTLKALTLVGAILASGSAYSLNSQCGAVVFNGIVRNGHKVTYSLDEQFRYGILHYQSIATRLFPRPNIQLGQGSPVVISILNSPSPKGHFFGIFGRNHPFVRWEILGASALSSPFRNGPIRFCNAIVTVSSA